MSTENVSVVSFLEGIMRRCKRLPCQLACDIGVSHTTVLRWLSGKGSPSTKSCHKLAEYSGMPLQKVLVITGHIPSIKDGKPYEWPEFRDYARLKYPHEFDEELITMIEDLIERRRQKRHQKGQDS